MARPGRASPLFCWLLGRSPEAKESHIRAQDAGIPVYRELYRTLECLDAVFSNPKGGSGPLLPAPEESVPVAPGNLLPPGRRGLGRASFQEVSWPNSVCPPWRRPLAGTSAEALDLARGFGYPVVLKGIAPELIHKTEQNMVRLEVGLGARGGGGLCRPGRAAAGRRAESLVQKQVKGGLELILGYVRDPQFGPCVMCGLGGVLAEVLGRASFALAPLSKAQGRDLLDRLPAQKLLNGFRGAQPADREALAEMLSSLGRFGAANPRIREIDLNPVIIRPGSALGRGRFYNPGRLSFWETLLQKGFPNPSQNLKGCVERCSTQHLNDFGPGGLYLVIREPRSIF